MSDKPKISPEDKDLFRQSVGKVKRLAHDRANPERPRPTLPPNQNAVDESHQHDALSDEYHPGDVETGEKLIFSRPGIQNSVLRKLHRGHFRIEHELDLHGFTVEKARTALVAFLLICNERGIRCVRIIHGKGHGSHQNRPVLKGMVNSWLRQIDEVLAFCSAQPADGGTGAVYVLLKQRQK